MIPFILHNILKVIKNKRKNLDWSIVSINAFNYWLTTKSYGQVVFRTKYNNRLHQNNGTHKETISM